MVMAFNLQRMNLNTKYAFKMAILTMKRHDLKAEYLLRILLCMHIRTPHGKEVKPFPSKVKIYF